MEISRINQKARNVIMVLFIILIFAIVIVSISVSSFETNELRLEKGKNLIELNLTQNIYVKELVKLNPTIEVISYKSENYSIGFVNVFSGIGENFEIKGGVLYEVITQEESNLVLPEK